MNYSQLPDAALPERIQPKAGLVFSSVLPGVGNLRDTFGLLAKMKILELAVDSCGVMVHSG